MSNHEIKTKTFPTKTFFDFLVGSEGTQEYCDIINWVTGSDRVTPENYAMAMPIAMTLIDYSFSSWSSLSPDYRHFKSLSRGLLFGIGIFDLYTYYASKIPSWKKERGSTIKLPQISYDELDYPKRDTFNSLLTRSIDDSMQYLPFGTLAGFSIERTIERAINTRDDKAKKTAAMPTVLELLFKGVVIYVNQDSTLTDLYHDYLTAKRKPKLSVVSKTHKNLTTEKRTSYPNRSVRIA